MSVRITNIQRMCFDDGPGIRTTVFLKGCSVHCPWCSNPENLSFEGQDCAKNYSAEELTGILLKDRKFWDNGGGVTFSGGEALLQAVQLEEVWRRLKAEGVHLAIETALFVPKIMLCIALDYIDFYYVDVKILDKETCLSVLGGKIEEYLANVEFLSSHGKEIHFRIPCSEEYVLQEENKELLCGFLKKYKQYPIEIFAIHDLGQKKYQALGQAVPKFQKVSGHELEIFRDRLLREGCKADIIEL